MILPDLPTDTAAFADQQLTAHLHSADDAAQKAIEFRGPFSGSKTVQFKLAMVRLRLAEALLLMQSLEQP